MTTSTTTNGQAEATVQTLTAEVRTLMVGNRQVTLSVYRQLDDVPYEQIEPFGRVRDKQNEEGGISVVGRDLRTGCLVRASQHAPSWSAWSAPAEFKHWYRHIANQPGGPRWVPGGTYVVVGKALELNRNLSWLAGEGRLDGCGGGVDFQEPRPTTTAGGPMDEWKAWNEAKAAHEKRGFQGDFCDLPALRAGWQLIAEEDLACLTAEEIAYRAVEALPLIVLAGLR